MTNPDGIPMDTHDDVEGFIGVDEVATITGYAPDTIRRLCQRDQIPHHQARPRAALLFLVSEVRAWLREGGQ